MRHITLYLALFAACALQSATATITVRFNQGTAVTADNLQSAINAAISSKDVTNEDSIRSLQITSGQITGTSTNLQNGWFQSSGDWQTMRSLKNLNTLSIGAEVALDSIPAYMFASSREPQYACPITTLSVLTATSIGQKAFNHGALATLSLTATPPTVNANTFAGNPADRTLVLCDTDGNPLEGTELNAAILKYRTANDGNATDNLWYGWTIPAIRTTVTTKSNEMLNYTMKVWTKGSGELSIYTAEPQTVYISDFAGSTQVINTTSGTNSVKLSSGNYIVHCGNESVKINVK